MSIKKLIILIILLALTGCKNNDPIYLSGDKFQLVQYPPVPVVKTNQTKIFVHYMPWYESREINGYWGNHWTMANRNPDLINNKGQRQIASYFYPLIGPYSSMDKDLIEYHLLLMKLCGIDGVLIDWYGSYDVYDYNQIKINSEALISMLNMVGLKFGIVYEDYTTQNVVNQHKAGSAVEASQNDIEYLDNNYFSSDQYIIINNSPLLLVFGPRYLQTPNDWDQVFSAVHVSPCFLTLWYESSEAGDNARGEFSWVYRNNLADLDNFYNNRASNFETAIGSAYPGFKDYYTEGGWPNLALGWQVPYDSTSTFSETLQRAEQANIPYVQLVTWNDFGEGTMIEPTIEFGYSLLEQVQQFAGVSYSKTDLQLVYNLYSLRKDYTGNNDVQLKLDQVFYYLVSLQIDKAKELLNSIQ